MLMKTPIPTGRTLPGMTKPSYRHAGLGGRVIYAHRGHCLGTAKGQPAKNHMKPMKLSSKTYIVNETMTAIDNIQSFV